jgi:hypothetical protein
MDQPYNPNLRRILLEIVENQLRDGIPPETSATLARLMSQGQTRENALELIACALTSEMFHVVKNNQPHDEVRYVALLLALPRLPWDDEADET